MSATPAPVASTAPSSSLVARIADRFGVEANKLMTTLKLTAFRQRPNEAEPTNEEMMALLIVSDQYKLNPFTKEIYAYLDKKRGGIVPVVSVDGWVRIVNEHPAYNGVEFRYSEETVKHKNKTCHVWIECAIHRRDRDRPVVLREFFEEVVRQAEFATPWDTHPNRMHRHKVFIQCARMAFGFAGIYDDDEAERIIQARLLEEPADAGRGTAALKQRLAGPGPVTVDAEQVQARQAAPAAPAPAAAAAQPQEAQRAPAEKAAPEPARRARPKAPPTVTLPADGATIQDWVDALKATPPGDRHAFMQQAAEKAPEGYIDTLTQVFDDLAFGAE